MTALIEGQHAGEFMVSEGNKTISREAITVAGGEALEAGTVLGKLSANGNYVQLSPGSEDGSETAVAILYAGADASDGPSTELPLLVLPR
nr:head decoration protein [Alkalilimnicola ehrlichii]